MSLAFMQLVQGFGYVRSSAVVRRSKEGRVCFLCCMSLSLGVTTIRITRVTLLMQLLSAAAITAA
jgi:hypothetical protein